MFSHLASAMELKIVMHNSCRNKVFFYGFLTLLFLLYLNVVVSIEKEKKK